MKRDTDSNMMPLCFLDTTTSLMVPVDFSKFDMEKYGSDTEDLLVG